MQRLIKKPLFFGLCAFFVLILIVASVSALVGNDSVNKTEQAVGSVVALEDGVDGNAEVAQFSSQEDRDSLEDKSQRIDAGSNQEDKNYFVTKVVDGDTIVVSNRVGEEKTVRLIGIDTPETVHPSKPVECFGAEASARLREILDNNQVRLESDPSQGEQDKYGRYLAYVFLLDADISVNEQLVQEGYAYEYTYSIPYAYQSAFKQAEQKAKNSERGLWAPGVCKEELGKTDSEVEEQNQPAPQPQSAPSTQCSANIYNCGDFTSSAEAQGIFDACGGVSNDIHRLDADKDGLACESLP